MATGYQNISDLIAAQNFLQNQQQYNYGGGGYGAYLQAQKDRQQKQSADQLQNFLTLQQSYPTMTPNKAVQGAASTMFGNQAQQSGLPGFSMYGSQNIMPNQTATQNQGQAKIDSTNQLMNYLQGIKDPKEQEMAQTLMGVGSMYTPYQKAEMKNRKDSLIKLIKSKRNPLDPTGPEVDRDSMEAIIAHSATNLVNINDPEIQDALDETYPSKSEDTSSSVKKPASGGNWLQTLGKAAGAIAPWMGAMGTGFNTPLAQQARQVQQGQQPQQMQQPPQMSPQIQQQIQAAKAAGYTDQQIKEYLMSKGIRIQ